jgi:hypothetical protein
MIHYIITESYKGTVIPAGDFQKPPATKRELVYRLDAKDIDNLRRRIINGDYFNSEQDRYFIYKPEDKDIFLKRPVPYLGSIYRATELYRPSATDSYRSRYIYVWEPANSKRLSKVSPTTGALLGRR